MFGASLCLPHLLLVCQPHQRLVYMPQQLLVRLPHQHEVYFAVSNQIGSLLPIDFIKEGFIIRNEKINT